MVSVTSPRGIAIQQAQSSTIRDRIERITEDLKDIKDFYPISISPRRTRELSRYLTSELESLRNLPFDHYDQDGKVDCLLVKNYLERQIRQLDLDLKQDKKAAPLLPFSATLIDLCEARALVLSLDPKEAAQKLFQSQVQMAALLEKIKKSSSRFQIEKTTAFRAVRTTDALRRHLKEWFNFYKGYDPMFDWWVKSPYVTVDKSLEDISLSIQEELVGIKPENDNAIVGDPIGREGLVSELMAEVIAYTPEEIISIGQKEFKWCVDELKKASHAMGYGGNWKEALEEVKHDFVEPGKQTDLVRDLTREAISFVDEHKLVTVPPIAKETWQMFMMSPERQKVNPFFLGGECIIVSYPTDEMDHEDKLMSMRGNNIHFSRATVFHEMIPGHHLQMHMIARHKPYRRLFDTPFWIEGWALYWEFVLWDDDRFKTSCRTEGWYFTTKNRDIHQVPILSLSLYGKRGTLGIPAS